MGKRLWSEAANGWRQLWEEAMDNIRALLTYQAQMVTTLDRAQSIAESFGAEDAFAFIIAELDDWPSPDTDG
jgi:predicted RNA polymerase sigma factor